MLVHVLLSAQAMTADRQPMIARKDDARQLTHTARSERVEAPAALLVQVADERVVEGQLLADQARSPRPGEQCLVTATQVAVVERVLGEEVGGKRYLRGVVAKPTARR